MKTTWIAFFVCLIPALAQTNQALRPVQTLSLPKTEGHLGHLAIDVPGQRLFVAATDANTVEAFDLKQGASLHSVSGFDRPSDVVFVPGATPSAPGKVFVSNADGKLRSFDTSSWQQGTPLDLGGPVGALRYDSTAKRLYAAFGDGGLAVIDPVAGTKVSELKLDGSPDAFQLERPGSRIFANVPNANAISVMDRKKPGAPVKIPVTWAQDNHIMALDEGNHRLFVGTRKPVKVLVLDTASSQWVTELPLTDAPQGDELGDIFYDAAQKRIYLISGSAIVPPDHVGAVFVLDQMDPDHYLTKEKAVTALGARTGLFVPELGRLFVALPAGAGNAAAIRVYATK